MLHTIEVDALATCHSHFREDEEGKEEIVRPLVEYAIEGGAEIVGTMPNTKAGLKTPTEVLQYAEHFLQCVPQGKILQAIHIMLVTPQTPLDTIRRARDVGITRVKFYPYMRTTKSEHHGIRHYMNVLPHIKLCGELEMDAHMHPEHPWLMFNNRDAEFAFLVLADIFLNETEARIFWEHGTDARCIPFWKEMALSKRFFVTLTAHHLATDEDSVFGDVRAVCKPPIKTRQDREALVHLVEGNYPWVLAGPDDAPHDVSTKYVREGRCSCGAFTTPFLHPLYAHALDRLLTTKQGVETYINFTSRNLRKALCLPQAKRKLTLTREKIQIPATYKVGPWNVDPFWAGQYLNWRIAD